MITEAVTTAETITLGGAVTGAAIIITSVVKILSTVKELTVDAREQAASGIGSAAAERDYFAKELDDERAASKEKDRIIREKDAELLRLNAFILKNGLQIPDGGN